jgi:polar amino acid transport system substrate-binding protein
VWAFGSSAARANTLQLVNDGYLTSSEDDADGKAPGFGIELVRQVFASMGQGVSIEILPTRRASMMVTRGERDGMLTALRTGEAERICSFPEEPLVYDRWVMFVRNADLGKLKYSSFLDLAGHNVAVHEPASGMSERSTVSPGLRQFLREHHNLVETTNTEEGLVMLAAGRVDYAVVNLAFGMNAIARTGLSGKLGPLLSRSVSERGVYVCFRKGRVSVAVVDAFSRALKEFKQTEAYQVLHKKYYR